MANLSREAIQKRIEVLDAARRRIDQRYEVMIERAQTQLAMLDAPEREPANDVAGAVADAPPLVRAAEVEPPPATVPDPPHLSETAPRMMRAAAVALPSPSTPPDAPSLEEAPELKRYVPTAEVLALTEPADVLTALGKLETPREEHELLSAWAVAGNRAALNAVAVHVGGPLGERAARSVKRLTPEPSAGETTQTPSDQA